ncbi:MAG: hypothetical protein ACP6IS_09000 [Candidatus Asgardarchaeia archaeon]
MFNRKWKIWVAGEKVSDEPSDILFEFIDSVEVLKPNRKITIRQELLDDLVYNIKKYDNYNAIKALKKVSDPDARTRNENLFIAIFCISKEGIRMGFLLELTNENVLVLTAFWPESLASVVSEKIELLDHVISALAQAPDYWKRVDVLLSEGKYL